MTEGRNDKPTPTRAKKLELVPSAGLYCIIALLLLLGIGLVITRSLVKISDLATTTRDEILPTIIDRQRTIVNLERLGRFAEVVYRSNDSKIRRQYKLAAHILSHDSVFFDAPELNKQVLLAYSGIEQINALQKERAALDNARKEYLYKFIPGTPNALALGSLETGNDVAGLLVRINQAASPADIYERQSEFDTIQENYPADSPQLQSVYEDVAALIDNQRSVIRTAYATSQLWNKVNNALETASANLSTTAAVNTDDSFTFISEVADQALNTGLLAAAALLVALLILLYIAKRNIVTPVIRSTQALDRISQGERNVTLPESPFKELDDIRLAVERSSTLMDELEDRTVELESANLALEDEIEYRQQVQEELAEAKKRAESADKAKSDFLAGMSHELRTPMNTMIGMGDLLLETDPTKTQRGYVEALQLSGQMLLDIINDVLDLSKIEAGEVEVEKVPIKRDEFLVRTRQIVSARAGQKGIDFFIDVDNSTVPPVFIGDPTRLRQVLVNLIDNGVKFTESGEVRLTVQGGSGEAEILTFAVIDTGIGISEDARRNIFDRFAQADSSTTRQYGGTGLGLSICKRLVELMDGELEVQSAIGQGSAFHFSIPLVKGDEKTLETEKSPAPPVQTEFLNDCPISILVAEDSESNRALIELYFKSTACELTFANDGYEAVEIFEKNRYDLILMDIQMPGMDGYQATRRIRTIEAKEGIGPIPIIAVTANAFKEDRERSQAAGCTDYLAKPVSKPTLLERVALHAYSCRKDDE